MEVVKMSRGCQLLFVYVAVITITFTARVAGDYVGCYVMRDDPRLWEVYDGVTNCMWHCKDKNRPLSAIWRKYCSCAENTDGLEKDPDGCTFKCSDDSSRLCGGSGKRVSIYNDQSVSGGSVPSYAWYLIAFASILLIVVILSAIKAVCCRKEKATHTDMDAEKRDPELHISLCKMDDGNPKCNEGIHSTEISRQPAFNPHHTPTGKEPPEDWHDHTPKEGGDGSCNAQPSTTVPSDLKTSHPGSSPAFHRAQSSPGSFHMT